MGFFIIIFIGWIFEFFVFRVILFGFYVIARDVFFRVRLVNMLGGLFRGLSICFYVIRFRLVFF